MERKITLRGVNGSIRWGYHSAATVGNWSVAPQKGGSFTFSASLVQSNTFQLSQKPLIFMVNVKDGALVWPILELTTTGNTIKGTLGPLGGVGTNKKGTHEQQNASSGNKAAGDQSG